MPVKILADATLPALSALFKPPFILSVYQNPAQLPALLPHNDVLLCRSTLRVDASLLDNSTLQCVATASSGVDHIDCNYLQQRNITLIDAKGSNARSVADYVIATLAALHRLRKPAGIRAGVIGIGEAGTQVVRRLLAAGYDVLCYDPIKAETGTTYPCCAFTELFACDVLCIHPNLHDDPPYPSMNLFNSDVLSRLKPGVIIINASRGGIIDENALLTTSTPITYCTDVYLHEPAIDARIIDFATLCTPHIAGHSIEAKQAAVVQTSQKIHQHFGLTMPPDALPALQTSSIIACENTWQECILSLYNPLMDTKILKTAVDKKQAFLTRRKAHQYRHDFNCYMFKGLDQRTRLLLGYEEMMQ